MEGGAERRESRLHQVTMGTAVVGVGMILLPV